MRAFALALLLALVPGPACAQILPGILGGDLSTGGGGGTITIVTGQSLANADVTGSGISTINTGAFSSSFTVGNAVIVGLVWDNSGPSTATVTLGTDGCSAWTPGRIGPSGNGEYLEFWLCAVATAAQDTVTANFSATAAWVRIQAAEVQTTSGTIAFDQASNGSGTGTALSSGTITPTQNGAFLMSLGEGGNTSVTVDSPFTSIAATNNFIAGGYYAQTTAAAIAGTFTQASSSAWSAGVVSLKAP